MEEIKLKIHSESSEDISREEMRWNSKNSDLLLQWSETCCNSSAAHKKKAGKFKTMFSVFGLPAVLIPLTIGILQPYMKNYDLLISLLMVLSSCFSAVTTFFDFGRKRSKHLDAETKYGELYLKIQTILAIPKRNRNAADVTITECLFTLNGINGSSPPL